MLYTSILSIENFTLTIQSIWNNIPLADERKKKKNMFHKLKIPDTKSFRQSTIYLRVMYFIENFMYVT